MKGNAKVASSYSLRENSEKLNALLRLSVSGQIVVRGLLLFRVIMRLRVQKSHGCVGILPRRFVIIKTIK